MRYVVAIDVGIKNLAVCAYDFVTGKIIHWDNVTLVPNGRYIPALNVQYVHDFVFKHNDLFNKAAVVLVERQMRCNMRIIESVLQSMFYERCVVVSPRCVKAHYGIGTRNYRANKAKAVEWARDFVTANPTHFTDPLGTRFLKCQKQDDLADALLMTTYYLDTYSNIPSGGSYA